MKNTRPSPMIQAIEDEDNDKLLELIQKGQNVN